MDANPISSEARPSDDFIRVVAERLLDVAAMRMAVAFSDRSSPRKPSQMPTSAVFGDVFSNDEAEELGGTARAVALSGYQMVFRTPDELEVAGLGRVGAVYSGNANAGDLKIAVSDDDLRAFSATWHTLYRRSTRIPFARRWLERYKSSLIHELRHAYDDTASEGMYRENTLAAGAEASRRAAADLPRGHPLRIAAYNAYLRAPHEVSARFTAAAASVPAGEGRPSWFAYRDALIKRLAGYQDLPEQVQTRLLRRMYREWHDRYPLPRPKLIDVVELEADADDPRPPVSVFEVASGDGLTALLRERGTLCSFVVGPALYAFADASECSLTDVLDGLARSGLKTHPVDGIARISLSGVQPVDEESEGVFMRHPAVIAAKLILEDGSPRVLRRPPVKADRETEAAEPPGMGR